MTTVRLYRPHAVPPVKPVPPVKNERKKKEAPKKEPPLTPEEQVFKTMMEKAENE